MLLRYASLHQHGIFPNTGSPDVHGDHNNILNIPLPYNCVYSQYEPLLRERALPFLKEFEPQLLIVAAGYDALASDDMAEV